MMEFVTVPTLTRKRNFDCNYFGSAIDQYILSALRFNIQISKLKIFNICALNV